MIDKLPHLINLLDDPDESIRKTVLFELEKIGYPLEEAVRNLDLPLDEERKLLLEGLFEKNDRRQLKKEWLSLQEISDDLTALEAGLAYVAKYQNGRMDARSVTKLLDALTGEFRERYKTPDHYDLIHFLFKEYGLKGAENDYYNPMNSNLVYVIEEKRGIPISLVSVLMLMGKRLGLPINGCNFPGHFLARFRNPVDGVVVLVDCFSGGHLIYEEDLESLDKEAFKDLLSNAYEKTDAKTILRRVVGNLLFAYRKNGDVVNSEFFESLLTIY